MDIDQLAWFEKVLIYDLTALTGEWSSFPIFDPSYSEQSKLKILVQLPLLALIRIARIIEADSHIWYRF